MAAKKIHAIYGYQFAAKVIDFDEKTEELTLSLGLYTKKADSAPASARLE
jgi:hypothetical protein